MPRKPSTQPNVRLIAARQASGLRPAQCARALEHHAHTQMPGNWLSFTCADERYRSWELGRIPREYVWPVLTSFFNATPAELGLIGAMSTASRNADLVAVATLHERVRELERCYEQATSTRLLGTAGQLLGDVRALRAATINARVRRGLYETEATAATLMSRLIWDASQRRDHDASFSYLELACEAARCAREPALEAYAVLRMSFISLYGEQDPATGRSRAEQAADIATGTSAALTGLSLLHVAEAHAMVREGAACENALKLAEAQLPRVDPDDTAGEYFSINELNRLAGSCFLFLGMPARAEEPLRLTVAALAGKTKSQAIALGNLTLSLIEQRKLDEAAVTMHHTIDSVEQTRGGGGLNVVFSAGRRLRPWRREPWVQDIDDRLMTLMATP